jgi:membrane protein involved in colicin uptake
MAEEEYFARVEAEKRARLAEELRVAKEAEAKKARREAHYHKCGKCGADMATHAFKGVEIEICGECQAVLLDPGELEALTGLDRSGIFSTLGELFGVKRGPRQA